MMERWKILRNSNIYKLYIAVFFSELGGYLTNTVILFHIFHLTDGNKFYLGLSQLLFVGPLALGTIIGGSIGENYNRRKIMVACEVLNLFLVFGLIFFDSIIGIILVRALIVFFAGVYNPSRMAIVQEICDPKNLRRVNSAFTAAYAIFHSTGPMLGAFAYQYFGGVREIFVTNVLTYLIGALFIYRINYIRSVSRSGPVAYRKIFTDIRDGFYHIRSRHDLVALFSNFSIGGICLGVFYPTLLPFLREMFGGDESMYGQVLLVFGVGGIVGAAISSPLMQYFKKGAILVSAAFLQAVLFLAWTQVASYVGSLVIVFIWGLAMMTVVTTYMNYVQLNVGQEYQSRTFSLYDQSISLSVVLGAAVVALVGEQVSAYQLMTATALATCLFMLVRLAFPGLRSLFRDGEYL